MAFSRLCHTLTRTHTTFKITYPTIESDSRGLVYRWMAFCLVRSFLKWQNSL